MISSPLFLVPSPTITLNLQNTIGDYTYSSSPTRPYTLADGTSISPPNLRSYTLSTSELSSDGVPPASSCHSRCSSTQLPPASIPYAATVPRLHCYNLIVIHPTRATKGAHKRRISRSNNDSDEEDEEFHRRPWSVVALTREHLGLL